MKNTVKTTLISIIVTLLTTGCASSDRNTAHHFLIADALNSAKAQEILDPSIDLQFASGSGNVIRSGLVSNRRTNAVNKSDEEACMIAFLSAVKQFQDTAQQNGASRVINLISYYRKQAYSSTTHYECYPGAVMAGVTLKGDIAR